MLPNMKQSRIRNEERVQTLYYNLNISPQLKQYFLNKKYYIETYGCQMNVHDSENIRAILESMGMISTNEMNNSDLIILNTCAIRENAHNKVFGLLGRIKHMKETQKEVITLFCGCMAQEENVANKLSTDYKWVDIVFGTHNIHEIPLLLEEYLKNKEQNICVYSKQGDIIEGIPIKRDSKYKAWVNIMYGCDKFCTYCIVPYTRGKQRSRLQKDIIEEVQELVKEGYQEVTLLGQNVNAYGKDLENQVTFAELLENIAKTKINRIRFVTSHPWDFTEEMISVISKYSNIMPYIHLPIQSGSNKILKKMGRRYTKEEYVTLFHKLKENIPNVSITTDIIVGFPNEEENDFAETLKIYHELKYDLAYTFIYSKRESTPAAKLCDNISEEIKKERLQRLNKVVNHYAKENNLKYLDKVVDVLIEGPSQKENCLQGYTDTMKLVNVKSNEKCIGKIIKVKITSAKTWSLDGVEVSD